MSNKEEKPKKNRFVDILGQKKHWKLEKEGDQQLMFHHVPCDLVKKFKAKAALNNDTMKNVIMELMKAYIRT